MEGKGPSLRILVVEDDQDTATSLTMLLDFYGYEAEVAVDGPSACRAYQANEPEVVLLDLGLPRMDGWEVAKQIRQMQGSQRPLLIAVTGYGDEASRCRSCEAGIDLHWVKPVDPQKLERLLSRFQSMVSVPCLVVSDRRIGSAFDGG
jgi:CheY-like chemotaxis protein